MRRKCSFKGYAKFWIDPNSPLHCAGKKFDSLWAWLHCSQERSCRKKSLHRQNFKMLKHGKSTVYIRFKGRRTAVFFALPCPENPRICSFWDLCTRTLDNLICSPDVGLRNLINTQYHSTKGFFRKRSPSAVCNCPIFLFPNEIRNFQSFKT